MPPVILTASFYIHNFQSWVAKGEFHSIISSCVNHIVHYKAIRKKCFCCSCDSQTHMVGIKGDKKFLFPGHISIVIQTFRYEMWNFIELRRKCVQKFSLTSNESHLWIINEFFFFNSLCLKDLTEKNLKKNTNLFTVYCKGVCSFFYFSRA